jgi:hypothetical protein
LGWFGLVAVEHGICIYAYAVHLPHLDHLRRLGKEAVARVDRVLSQNGGAGTRVRS